MEKKILIAIDGSVYSLNSIDYAIRLFCNDPTISLHLFSVVSESGGGQNWMYEVDSHRSHTAVAERRKLTAEKYLRDAKARLVRNGCSDDRISFEAQITPILSAAAIHMEASRGIYDALVIGRRGMGKMGEFFFGSVSAYLVDKCHEIPLWIVDGEVTSDSFLLAVQTKPKSLLAADHLGFIAASLPDSSIYLYHSKVIFGSDPDPAPEEFYPVWGKEWCDEYLDIENYLFYAHAQVLKDHGINPKRIIQLPMERRLDVSRDLIRKARKHKCGAIVIGRRSRDEGKGWLGGVSGRTLNQAQNLALWLVG